MQRNPLNANTPVASVKTTSSRFETYDGGVLTKCKVELDPIQDLHGYDYPWAGGAGKNILNPTLNTTSQYFGVDYTNLGDGTYNLDGKATANGGPDLVTNITLKAGTYKIIGFPSGVESSSCYIGLMNGGSYIYKSGTSFTLVSDTTFDSLRIRPGNGKEFDNVILKPMITSDLSLTYEDFEPYENICPISGHTEVQVKNNSTTYTINLGGTYYEGTLDVASGELVINKLYKDITTLDNLRYASAWGAFVGDFSDSKVGSMDFISSAYGAGYFIINATDCLNAPDGKIYRQSNNAQFFIKDARFTDVASFVSALSGQTLCYELATPTTIKLFPTYINSDVGMNTVSCPLSNQYISTNGIEYKDVFAYGDIKYSEAANVSRQIGYEHEGPITMDLSAIPNGVYFVIAKALYFDYAHFAVISKHNSSILILTQTSSAFSASGTDLSYAGDWYSNVYLKDATGYIFYG